MCVCTYYKSEYVYIILTEIHIKIPYYQRTINAKHAGQNFQQVF